ncbi:MAG: hypothetical protein M1272_07405 [Firmicutes bacterium]|nr:hypothetical protein [Bacillota bacterium]
MKRWVRLISGALSLVVLGLAVWAGWAAYERSVERAQAIASLNQLPPVRAYPNGVMYRGQRDGIESQVIESVEPVPHTAEFAQSAGNFILTYTGAHPPAITYVEIDGSTLHTDFVIVGHGWGFTPHKAVQIAYHHYVYWDTQWQNISPFNVAQTRQEYRTSTVSVHLASGRVVRITQHPVPVR